MSKLLLYKIIWTNIYFTLAHVKTECLYFLCKEKKINTNKTLWFHT